MTRDELLKNIKPTIAGLVMTEDTGLQFTVMLHPLFPPRKAFCYNLLRSRYVYWNY